MDDECERLDRARRNVRQNGLDRAAARGAVPRRPRHQGPGRDARLPAGRGGRRKPVPPDRADARSQAHPARPDRPARRRGARHHPRARPPARGGDRRQAHPQAAPGERGFPRAPAAAGIGRRPLTRATVVQRAVGGQPSVAIQARRRARRIACTAEPSRHTKGRAAFAHPTSPIRRPPGPARRRSRSRPRRPAPRSRAAPLRARPRWRSGAAA